MENKQFYCRWSPTLGALEDSHENVWGTLPYELDLHEPTVFFGLYGLPDWYALWRHKGPKYILWAGSDITHFLKGYWLDEKGNLKINPFELAPWIDTYCESFVENDVEQAALASVGVRSKVVPSFLGLVTGYPQSYQHSLRPKLYTSVSGDNFELYGWDKIPKLAADNPDIEFHLYGNTAHPWNTETEVFPYPANILLHGRLPKEQMNEEISHMQGALRLTSFDGFSEILAKSVLMEQWPVSLIEYPHMLKVSEISRLKDLKESNVAGREYYQKVINNFPWNKNRS